MTETFTKSADYAVWLVEMKPRIPVGESCGGVDSKPTGRDHKPLESNFSNTCWRH